MAANTAFELLNQRGWKRGFNNLLRKEVNSWSGTRTWWVQCLIWIAILNGMLFMLLRPLPEEMIQAKEQAQAGEMSAFNQATKAQSMQGLMIFIIFSGMAVPIAAIAIGQDTIIGEKQTGTAAWILSKPASRPAFIISKLIANAAGMLITALILPGVIAYLQISAAHGEALALISFAAGVGLVFLNLLFYLTLTVMLGAFFESRGPVLGIALAILFAWQFLSGIAPWLTQVMPWGMVVNTSQETLPLAFSLASGQPLPTIMPIYGTIGWCLLFIALAIWKFQREEF
jgi:ABC-2 type transport system permease protein